MPTAPVPVPTPPRPSRRTLARAYFSLTKPRIVELLLVTTVPAMVLAVGGLPPLGPAVAVLVGGALAAGAANALNCYLDRDIDQVMRRTARRPLPAHVLSPRNVLFFGLVLGVTAVGLMAAFTNPLAAALTLGAILYYDLVYTMWLKRTTPLNTVAGGVCGAAPVLIGWAAMTGSLGTEAWLMFAVVFLWQPPHFYALALRFRDDYARAGIPMLPVVASTRRVTAECVVYSWLTVAASLALWPVAMSPLYGVVAVALGGLLVTEAHRLHRRAGRADRAAGAGDGGGWDGVTGVAGADRTGPANRADRADRGAALRPMRLFHWSTSYLTVLFVSIAADALIG
jgi:protoheme IX farnesyltransferase